MKGYDNENDAIKAELDTSEARCRPRAGHHRRAAREEHRANILHQVGAAVARYRSLVDQGELAVVGAFYDFTNALGKGFGRVIIVTVNGVTGIDKLKTMPELKGLDPDTFVGV
jgi:carbonic anhydrase